MHHACCALLPIQDKAVRARVDALNKLESAAHAVKSALREGKAQDKLGADERQGALAAVDDALAWLEDNADADVDELQERLREVRVCRAGVLPHAMRRNSSMRLQLLCAPATDALFAACAPAAA